MSYQLNEYCGVCHKDETIVLDNCPICLENISQINRTTTPCGHTFHGSCIFDYIIASYSCPTRMSLYCPLCRKIAFNNDEDGCQRRCCRPDLVGFRSFQEEDEKQKADDKADDEAYDEYYFGAYKNVPENVPENDPDYDSIPDYNSEIYSDYDYEIYSDYDSIPDFDPNYDSDTDYHSNYDSENYYP